MNINASRSHGIEKTLSSKVRIRILVFLASNRGTAFSRYKIASATSVSIKEASKHMKILVGANLVKNVGDGVELYSFNGSEDASLLAEFLRRSVDQVSNC